jgi:nitrous oxidase accessory protein NosD
MSARRGLFQRFRTVDRIGSRSRRRRLDTKGRKLNLESLEARTLLSATIWVDDDNISGIEDGSSAYPYNTIQEGISAVDAGGTVNVAAGTYTRTGAGSSVVDINKSVNLRGANADVLPGAARGPESVIDGNSAGENYYVVQISANDATLNGFSITNPLYNSTADAAGVTITSARYSNLRVAYNIIHDIGTPTRSPADFGTFGLNVGPVDGLQIDHNEIYNIANGDLDQRSIGIFTWGNDETDNTHNLLIADNNVHDITAAPAASYGIYTGFFGDGIAVSGNTLTNTGRYGISTNEWGLSPVSITDNAITGAADAGIRIRSVWSDTVSGNSVTGNSTGMLVQDVATAAPAVHNNDLSDNSSFGLNNLSAVTVDATANWWGDASGPFHATGNPAGTGSPVSDHVSFDPWVGKSTDGDNAVVDPDIEQWLFNEIVEDAGAGNDIVTTTIGSQAELGSFIALAWIPMKGSDLRIS